MITAKFVKDKYRVNALSKIPGGYTVSIRYTDDTVLMYENVKYPKGYANKVLTEARLEGRVDSILNISDSSGNTWYDRG